MALAVPTTVGVNTTAKVPLAPAVRLGVKPVVIENREALAPDRLMPLMLSVPEPEFCVANVLLVLELKLVKFKVELAVEPWAIIFPLPVTFNVRA